MGPDSLLQKILCLTCILAVLVCPGLFADLGDFGKEVEKEKEKQQEEDAEEKPPVFDFEDDPRTEVDEGWRGAIFYLIYPIVVWAAYNISTYYPPYPYAASEYTTEYTPTFAGNTIDDGDPYLSRKRMKGSFRTSGGFFYEGGDPGATVAASASGMIFGILGPEFEYRWWGDASGDLHFFRLGGIVPIIQSDLFTFGVPMAAAFYVDAFNLTGFALGGVIQSFPVRPLSVEIRGGSVFSPELTLWEAGGRISFYVDRIEIYTGYYGLYFAGRGIHSVDFGIGISI